MTRARFAVGWLRPSTEVLSRFEVDVELEADVDVCREEEGGLSCDCRELDAGGVESAIGGSAKCLYRNPKV